MIQNKTWGPEDFKFTRFDCTSRITSECDREMPQLQSKTKQCHCEEEK